MNRHVTARTDPPPPIPGPPPWYREGRRREGLHERRDNAALRTWLASDGHALGDPKRLPWCGDFVETCIRRTLPDEPVPANPYLAANWARFGIALAEPAIGAVLVFVRPGGGHVGFYAGERRSDRALRCFGGNQLDAVGDVWIARSRLVATRWPRTHPAPRTGRVVLAAAGPLSTDER